VVAERCAELRLNVVDRPGFSARAWPNGVVEIRSGALLRIENEAQLACVLAHEAAHYERGHSLSGWYIVGSNITEIVEWIAAGTKRTEQLSARDPFGYGWAEELETDRPTLERLVAAGYDPNEAPRLWEALREERERLEATDRRPFPLGWVVPERERNPEIEGDVRLPVVTSHWLTPARISQLRSLAASLPPPSSPDPIGRDAYRSVVAPFRGAWLAAELRQLHFEADAHLLERLRAAEPDSGELLFFAAELRRLRGEPGDLEAALALFEQARDRPDAPVEVWRSIGLVAARLGRSSTAREALTTCLARAPFAGGEGIRAEFHLRDGRTGVAHRGLAVARIVGGRLFAIVFVAAEDHHFPTLLPAVERIDGSARIVRGDQGAAARLSSTSHSVKARTRGLSGIPSGRTR
jgi:predicted Zn-dependent protease